MRKFLIALLVSLAVTVAAAFEVPSDSQVLIEADGQVVGTGSFEDGNLELDLLAGFSGFATVIVTDSAGVEMTFEVMVGEDASLVLSDTLVDIRDAVVDAGGQVVITIEERIAVDLDGDGEEDVEGEAEAEVDGSNAFGAGVPDHVDLPDVAVDGQAGAETNHAEARTRVEAGRSDKDGVGEEEDGASEEELDEQDDVEDAEDEDEAGEGDDEEGEVGAGANGNVNARGGAGGASTEGGVNVGIGVGGNRD